MKVNVIRKHLHATVDGKPTKLELGEQEVSADLGARLVKSGLALNVEAKTEGKESSASDIVKLIKSAESLDLIEAYAEDGRKTVKEAYEAKLAELAE